MVEETGAPLILPFLDLRSGRDIEREDEKKNGQMGRTLLYCYFARRSRGRRSKTRSGRHSQCLSDGVIRQSSVTLDVLQKPSWPIHSEIKKILVTKKQLQLEKHGRVHKKEVVKEQRNGTSQCWWVTFFSFFFNFTWLPTGCRAPRKRSGRSRDKWWLLQDRRETVISFGDGNKI